MLFKLSITLMLFLLSCGSAPEGWEGSQNNDSSNEEVDCAGVLNGSSVEDCAGVCNGSASTYCARECMNSGEGCDVELFCCASGNITEESSDETNCYYRYCSQ